MNECFSRKKEIRIIWNNQRKEEKMNEPRKIQKKNCTLGIEMTQPHTHTHAHMLMFRIFFFEILKSKSIIFHFNSMILNHIYNDDDDYDEASAFFHQNNKKRKLHLN